MGFVDFILDFFSLVALVMYTSAKPVLITNDMPLVSFQVRASNGELEVQKKTNITVN